MTLLLGPPASYCRATKMSRTTMAQCCRTVAVDTTRSRNVFRRISRPPCDAYSTAACHPDSFRSSRRSPLPWPTCANPTPYDIFHLPKKAPYNKASFYELVKLYHPDHQQHSPYKNTLSHKTCLERYRLIVLAHTILSDPSKRRAYDLHGAGWHTHARATLHTADRNWRHAPGSAANNATWEDWEEWRARQADPDSQRGKQQPIYMSNNSFAALVIACVVVAGLVEAVRIEHRSHEFALALGKQQRDLNGGMEQRSAALKGLGRTERVESFARDRENSLYGFSPNSRFRPEPEVPRTNND